MHRSFAGAKTPSARLCLGRACKPCKPTYPACSLCCALLQWHQQGCTSLMLGRKHRPRPADGRACKPCGGGSGRRRWCHTCHCRQRSCLVSNQSLYGQFVKCMYYCQGSQNIQRMFSCRACKPCGGGTGRRRWCHTRHCRQRSRLMSNQSLYCQFLYTYVSLSRVTEHTMPVDLPCTQALRWGLWAEAEAPYTELPATIMLDEQRVAELPPLRIVFCVIVKDHTACHPCLAIKSVAVCMGSRLPPNTA